MWPSQLSVISLLSILSLLPGSCPQTPLFLLKSLAVVTSSQVLDLSFILKFLLQLFETAVFSPQKLQCVAGSFKATYTFMLLGRDDRFQRENVAVGSSPVHSLIITLFFFIITLNKRISIQFLAICQISTLKFFPTCPLIYHFLFSFFILLFSRKGSLPL